MKICCNLCFISWYICNKIKGRYHICQLMKHKWQAISVLFASFAKCFPEQLIIN
ncbi:hypothetical protein HMPREF2531_00442 [Bacteroides intestinalis]|uniref:Uncharacterized protein n=2 Tax=Bacteroides TaxID=816 RepID=A0A139LU26_9BACE|nr:hypothetical protein BACCELL_05509 [Bacteroides cellulosilyticus DSM 14838]KXT54961.1 hypothetical protein HMPREF2531_00442 [Bacteroides intestinalis]